MTRHITKYERSDLLNEMEVSRRTGLTIAQLNAAIVGQDFPRPTSDSGEPRWYASEVSAWLALPKSSRRYMTAEKR